jgi:hypothetical protein
MDIQYKHDLPAFCLPHFFRPVIQGFGQAHLMRFILHLFHLSSQQPSQDSLQQLKHIISIHSQRSHQRGITPSLPDYHLLHSIHPLPLPASFSTSSPLPLFINLTNPFESLRQRTLQVHKAQRSSTTRHFELIRMPFAEETLTPPPPFPLPGPLFSMLATVYSSQIAETIRDSSSDGKKSDEPLDKGRLLGSFVPGTPPPSSETCVPIRPRFQVVGSRWSKKWQVLARAPECQPIYQISRSSHCLSALLRNLAEGGVNLCRSRPP